MRQLGAVAELRQRGLEGAAVDRLLEEAVRCVEEGLGADAAGLLELMPGGDLLLIRAARGFPGDAAAAGTTRPTAPDTVSGHLLRAGRAVVCHDLEADERFGQSPVLRAAGARAMVGVRVGPSDRPFGVLGGFHRSPGAFGAEDGWFVEAIAQTVAVAVDRARADARVRDSEARFRELADAAPVMIWTTDERGDVTFINRGWLHFTGTTLAQELGSTWDLGVHPDDAEGVLSTWRSALAARRPWEREYRLRRAGGEYRWIVDRGVPRFEQGEFIGYVGTATDIHERKSMEERLVRVYEHEHEVAVTLQRSLLPERLPALDGLELAARYVPAGHGAAIGGDWYDVVELLDGRVALAVGDVVGHGLRAAAVMGQLRTALRAYALVDTSPADILARLGRLLAREGQEATATVALVVLDRASGEISFTCAGHPPPLLLASTGVRFLEGGRSAPTGAAEPATFHEAHAELAAGSTLVLYTDGLVERRDVPLDQRLDRLAAVVRAEGELPLERLSDRLLEAMLPAGEVPDDVALLAVRRQPMVVEAVELTLPAEPAAVPNLRRHLERFLAAAGASEGEVYEITLAISEAAGNVVEHAYGSVDASFDVSTALEDGSVVAAVRDRGRWRKLRDESRGRGLPIMRALMDDVEVSSAEDGTVVRMRRSLGDASSP